MLKETAIYEKVTNNSELYIWTCLADKLAEYYHFHNRFEIIYVLDGTFDLFLDGTIHNVEKDDIVIINKLEKHCYKNVSDNLSVFVCVLGDYYLKDFFIEHRDRLFPNLLSKKEFNKSIKKYFDEWKKIGNKNIMYNISYFNLILASILEKYETYPNTENETNKLASNVIEYIKEHYNEQLTQKQLAERTGYSSSYFSSIFKEIVGMNFKSYLNKIRITKANDLLNTTNKSNEQIAGEVGFSSMSAFYRAKAQFNM